MTSGIPDNRKGTCASLILSAKEGCGRPESGVEQPQDAMHPHDTRAPSSPPPLPTRRVVWKEFADGRGRVQVGRLLCHGGFVDE